MSCLFLGHILNVWNHDRLCRQCIHQNNDQDNRQDTACDGKSNDFFLFLPLGLRQIVFFLIIFVITAFDRACHRLDFEESFIADNLCFITDRRTIITHRRIGIHHDLFKIIDQLIHILVTVFRLFMGQLNHNIIDTGRYIRQNFFWRHQFLLDMLNGNGDRILLIKRKLSGQQLIIHNAKGIKVGTLIHKSASRLLR